LLVWSRQSLPWIDQRDLLLKNLQRIITRKLT
jgi:hypothetical protein